MSDIVRERRGSASAGANIAPDRQPSNPFQSVLKTLRLILALAVGTAVALGIGFFAFVEDIARTAPPADPRAEGIVVLTGGSARIDGALRLMAEGRASRVLISGVNPAVGRDALAGVLESNLDEMMECCVDLGHAATDTNTNASETRDWAARQGFSSLIVVTSAYHMPRSLAELRAAMPDVTLVPYPIATPELHLVSWWRDSATFTMLAREYGKFLVASARTFLNLPTSAHAVTNP